MSEMIDYVKHCRARGERDASMKSKSHLFMEYHNYEIKTQMQTRFLLMIYANLVATIVTNPIDVCLTKLITQKERKYSGLIDCLRQVHQQEGPYKFLSGIHPRFMFNTINGCLFLYLYEQMASKIYDISGNSRLE